MALSSGDAWKGIRLDQITLPATAQRPGYLKHHSVLVHTGEPVAVESSWADRRESAVLKNGDVMIVPAGVPYAARWDRPWEIIALRLSVDAVSSLAPAGGDHALRYTFGCQDPLIRDLALVLRREVLSGREGGARYAHSMGTAMIAHLIHDYSAQPARDRVHRGGLPLHRLRQVKEYVEENLGGALRLARLAELAGASVRQFLRAFKQSTGSTPHQYVLCRRVERAKELLAQGHLTVAEVASRCGFASQSRFAAAFQRLTRATPGSWRHARD
ncbi:MAG: AraC family transcriptional regulator [Myxococcales bacterium]